MDNQEAKFILRAFRPNGADQSDAMFSEALNQARQDPALEKWLHEEQSLDRVVSARLKAMAPPSGLRETILSGVKVSEVKRAWWRDSARLAVAASVLILIGLAFTWSYSRRSGVVVQMANFAIDDVVHGRHANRGEANANLRARLENASFHLSTDELPANLAGLEATGCRTLRFAGHSIAEVCFARAGHEFHLYVMSRMKEMPDTPKLMERDSGSAAAWSDAKYSYVVATTAAMPDLKTIL